MTAPVADAVLGLYRAAREFTRRVVGVEALERAALEYARSRGWVEAKDPRASYVSPSAFVDAALATVKSLGWYEPGVMHAACDRQERLDKRITELEGALRAIRDGQPAGYRMTRSEMESLAREVLR